LGIAAGLIPVSDFGISRGQEVALAADLFRRLPLFPSATVMEILDIRRELETQLVRFRSAILKFSGDIKNAGWDEDFGEDAERVFRQNVAPAIVDLEDAVESNSFLIEIANRIVPAGAVAASALALSISNLPNAALAALGIGGVVGTATIVQAYTGWAEKQRTAKQNQLYFYYRTGQLLRDGSHRYVSERE